MYNRNFGFFSYFTNALFRTTNGGVNWTQVTGADGFYDMKFVNALTGWKAKGSMQKTTDGGLNWVQQTLPFGGVILSSNVVSLSVLNHDTLWAVGGNVFYGSGQFKGIIFRTTNGGNNWLFQVPDTTIHYHYYSFVQFINAKTGWVYRKFSGRNTYDYRRRYWLDYRN